MYGSQPFGDSHSVSFGESSLVTIDRRAWTGTGEAVVTVSRIGFDGDTVWGVERDELGVEYIVRYRLARGG